MQNLHRLVEFSCDNRLLKQALLNLASSSFKWGLVPSLADAEA